MASVYGVEKQLEKIESTLQSGAYYEAQQMYKTVYHRYKARQQIESSYYILCEGAMQQLNSGQVACGVELGMLLLEAYSSDKVEPTPEALGRVVRIVQAFPPPAAAQAEDATQLEECVRFVSAAIKWAHKSGNSEGARQLKDLLGGYIWKSYGLQALGLAVMHLIQGNEPDLLAKVLVQVIPQGKPEEADLFIARAILQALAAARGSSSAQQLEYASELITACKQLGLWKETPLLKCVHFVVQVLEQNMPRAFALLREKYRPSLERDSCLDAYLAKIEQVYFQVDNGGSMSNLLGNFMRMLGDGDDE